LTIHLVVAGAGKQKVVTRAVVRQRPSPRRAPADRFRRIFIRVFTRLRELLASHKELRDKIDEHDKQLKVVFETIRKLLTPPEEPPKRRIGFGVE
jgi:hypothetical protein